VNTLDKEIGDAINLIAILLVFVFAYFSAVWPQAASLIDEPSPSVQTDKKRLVGRLRVYQRLLVGLAALIASIIILLAPLTRRVGAELSWGGSYDILRAGLLLVDVLLVSTLCAAVLTWNRLRQRINELSPANASPVTK
jgi:O-antigen/teichoic acid export membrane protein